MNYISFYIAYKFLRSKKSSRFTSIISKSSVIGISSLSFNDKKNGITEPLEPITLPYLTTLKDIFCFPLMLLAAINNLSEQSFVAPYRLIGAAALSVDRAITFLTLVSKHALIKFSAPMIMFRRHQLMYLV